MVSRSLCLFALTGVALVGRAATLPPPPSLIGSWEGTSTCVNLKIAPNCHDEHVIYDVRESEKPGHVTVKADKVVNGERLPMGELEFTYSTPDACWSSEISNARVHAEWCLAVDGSALTGVLRQLPSRQTVREIRLKRR